MRTCDHEGIRISITITNIPTSPSSGSSSSSSSSRSHQQPQQKWQAHKNVVLLFGLYYCHDSPEHQVSSKSTFCELRLVAAHFMSQRGFIVFSNVFIRLIVLSWMGQAFTNKVLNQKVIYFLYCLRSSGVHPILHPPLLFPLRHGMQQAHHFVVAAPLRQVVGCLASVDRSW